jgi:competence protein ComEC
MPLTVHFLNVGHGDCTLIEHASGRVTMIDINRSKQLPQRDLDALAAAHHTTRLGLRLSGPPGFRSWEDYYRSLLVDPCTYFDAWFPGRSVFRYLQTHPDMDHMTGLFEFFYNGRRELENFWDVEHSKTMSEDELERSPYDYADWVAYQLMQYGQLADGRTHKVHHKLAGATGDFWTPDGIEVLAPTTDLIDYSNRTEDWNNLSYVVRVSHAGRSIILPGDAEKPEWDKIESLADAFGWDLRCDILKASHHGRESGYSESAVDAMSPDFVVCSVGKKPDTDASDEYAAHGARVLSTRYHGTIRVKIADDGALSITDHNGTILGSNPALYSWRG